MTTLGQFETITRLGTTCNGRRIMIRSGARRAYYTIELPRPDEWGGSLHRPCVQLVPVARAGSIAESTLPRDSYAYTHGGALFVEAVEAAKEIASALGFPH